MYQRKDTDVMTPEYSTENNSSICSSMEDLPMNLLRLHELPIAARQKELLDLIDNLRRTTTNVPLPQLVVVGDQSSGKSSVLEALTFLRFPARGGGQCTSFATQISMRREPKATISASIIPDENRLVEEKENLQKFHHKIIDQKQGDLEAIIESATSAIWPNRNRTSSYAEDILSIEAVGPKYANLSIIDLPGYIQVRSRDEWAADADVEQVKELATKFLKDPKTVILAVTHAATDYQNQTVLSEVQKVDPRFRRTLGIITKPDTITDRSAIWQYIDLAKNERIPSQLGWHVLRNRPEEEQNISWEERNQREKSFFDTHREWTEVGHENIGILPLIEKLGKIIFSAIAHALPSLLREYQQRQDDCMKRLRQLGDCKDTVPEMREQVRRYWVQSHGTITQGVHAQYMMDQEFFNPDKKMLAENGISMYMLRACIGKQNEIFDRTMRDWASAYNFIDIELESPPRVCYGSAKPELVPCPKRVTWKQFIAEDVKPLLEQYKGQQNPGDTDPTLLYSLFQKLSSNWQLVVDDHVRRVYSICSVCVQLVVREKWPERMQDALWKVSLNDQMDAKLSSAQEEMRKIFLDHSRCMQTHDPEYIRKVRDLEITSNNRPGNSDPAAIAGLTSCEDIMRKTWTYYRNNLDIFISNIIVQVVERHLVYGLIELFDQSQVSNLCDEEVREIAEENEEARKKRDMLKNEKEQFDHCVRMIQELSWGKDWRSDLRMHSFPAWEQPRSPPTPQTAEPVLSPGPGTMRIPDNTFTPPSTGVEQHQKSACRKPLQLPFPPPGFPG
ncbi:P-loop containing nucleoside triphosphate hydrolase protein [Aspergillus keveii]|uniref:P-loop containing nucleoside triphosphate hydrolase protein n=1 Tax=Aspergillus keveii TaxID=714993 RepID=A0ABR4FXN0_9EURO